MKGKTIILAIVLVGLITAISTLSAGILTTPPVDPPSVETPPFQTTPVDASVQTPPLETPASNGVWKGIS